MANLLDNLGPFPADPDERFRNFDVDLYLAGYPPFYGRDIYLALSGGGFRATAHHLGVLLAYLRHNFHHRLCFVNAVSGGAIAAGWFGTWLIERNEKPIEGLPALRHFAKPLITLMRANARGEIVGKAAISTIHKWVNPDRVSTWEKILDRHLFQGRKLNKLEYPPLFIFSATDLATGCPFYITSAGLGFRPHFLLERFASSGFASKSVIDMPVAKAVAVSSCFPPIFRPMPLKLIGREAEDYRNSPYFSFVKGFNTGSSENGRSAIMVPMLDGGVSDNDGITFFADLASRGGLDGTLTPWPFLKFILNYKAGGMQELQQVHQSGWSRVGLLYRLQDRIYARREELNDRLVRIAARSLKVNYGALRAVPILHDDLGISAGVLHALAEIRTDLDTFTDTEIYALAYAGYRLANFGFSSWKMVPSTGMTNERLEKEFQAIMEGMLDPSPSDAWEKHLRPSRSRIGFWRKIRRGVKV